MRLKGTVAVVTGAGKGIGREIALAYAAEGSRVVCVSRSPDQLEEVVAEIRRAEGNALAVAADVTDDRSVDQLVQATIAACGKVDILVNNAGAHWPGRFLDYSVEDWKRMFDVNVFGVVRMTRAFLPVMLENGYGKVVNVASTAGKYGSMFQSPYNSSKHAVIGLTRCLALETAKQGISVNAICPGFVETEMLERATERLAPLLGIPPADVPAALVQRVPLGRLLRPDEVAPLAVYLAAHDSDGMTGQALTIDGALILV